jgi:hypothetical protein
LTVRRDACIGRCDFHASALRLDRICARLALGRPPSWPSTLATCALRLSR